MRSSLRVCGCILLALLFASTSSRLWAEEPKAAENEQKAAAEADPAVVPDGSPAELMKYIDDLRKLPQNDPQRRKEIRSAMVQAAEKIMAAKPGEAEVKAAVEVKMAALGDDLDKLSAFAAELKADGRAKLARTVRGFALFQKLRLDRPTPQTSRQRCEEIVQYLAEAPPESGNDAFLAQIAGQMTQLAGDNALALSVHEKLMRIFEGSADPKLQEFGRSLEGTIRRLKLPGNPIAIEGKLLGGEKLDWAKYAGKVVLVDFWATWCGPCVREIPGIKKCYELYRDKGFEVVGLSCDRSHDALEKFVKDQEIPWPIVVGEDGGVSPTVHYYGINSIPQMILVGKDGRVVTLDARGEKLRKHLEEILGPVEEKPAEELKPGDKKDV